LREVIFVHINDMQHVCLCLRINTTAMDTFATFNKAFK